MVLLLQKNQLKSSIIEKFSFSNLIFPSAYAEDTAGVAVALRTRSNRQPPATMISCSNFQIRDSTTGYCRPKTAQELCEEQETLTNNNECLTQNEIGTYEVLHHKNR